MNKSDLQNTLFEEQSLGELLRVFESTFSGPLPAKATSVCVFLLMLVLQIAVWQNLGIEVQSLQRSASLMASFSLTVSSALLGVVIAGMSIFAASLKPKVANSLIETPYPGTKISSLKFIFSMFAYVLFSLFFMIGACAVYYILLGENSFLLSVVFQEEDVGSDSVALRAVLVLYVALLAALIVFLGSLLKSFIWNLHQVLLVVVAFNGQADE